MDEKVKKILKEMYERYNFNYDENKDLYSNYASQLMNLPYEECMEWKDNKPYPLGKERRMMIKLFVMTQF